MSGGIPKSFIEFLRNKKSAAILFIGLLGIALIFISGTFSETKEPQPEIEEETAVTADDYRKQLEQELSEIISYIDGAGEVKILITMETGTEDVYAVEKKTEEKTSQSAEDDSGSSEGEYKEENKYVTVKRKDGSEDAVLRKQIMPKIRGVLVVCDGGGNSVVKEKITQAVSGALNISGRISCGRRGRRIRENSGNKKDKD